MYKVIGLYYNHIMNRRFIFLVVFLGLTVFASTAFHSQVDVTNMQQHVIHDCVLCQIFLDFDGSGNVDSSPTYVPLHRINLYEYIHFYQPKIVAESPRAPPFL